MAIHRTLTPIEDIYKSLYSEPTISPQPHGHPHAHRHTHIHTHPSVIPSYQTVTVTPAPATSVIPSYQTVTVTPYPVLETLAPYPARSINASYQTVTVTPSPLASNNSGTPIPISQNVFPVQFWIYKEPWDYFKLIAQVLGKPDNFDNCSGGSATWFKKSSDTLFGIRNVFAKHILRDQKINVRCPKRQVEFFYSYINCQISYDKLPHILSISPGISYDSMLKELCVRSANMGQNIVLMSLIFKVINGIADLRTIHSEGLLSKIYEESTKPLAIIEHYRYLTGLVPQLKTPINNETIKNKREYSHNVFPVMFKD